MGELSTDTHTYLTKMRAALDARMARANDVASAAAARDAARAAFDEAEVKYGREYRAAREAGWTDKELRDAGLTPPATPVARRTARRVSRPSAASRQTPQIVDGDSPQQTAPVTS